MPLSPKYIDMNEIFENRNGFIVGDELEASCISCLKAPEDPWSEPWLFFGEKYTCFRCKERFQQPEE